MRFYSIRNKFYSCFRQTHSRVDFKQNETWFRIENTVEKMGGLKKKKRSKQLTEISA